MKRSIVSQIVSGIVLCMVMLVLTACTPFGTGGKVTAQYKYKDPGQCRGYIVTKTVYEEDRLKIHLKVDPTWYEYASGDVNYVSCYRKDFSPYGEVGYSYQNHVLTIEADAPEEISGVMIQFQDELGLKLRYLDSQQFAGLAVEFVCDLGEVEYGDEQAYYTDQERQKEKERQEELEVESQEAFRMVEGRWIDPNGDSYVRFTTKDGTYFCEVLIAENEETGENAYSYEVYIESFTYDLYESAEETQDGESYYEIYGSTGNMTAPVTCYLYLDPSLLEYEYSDIRFVREQ